MPSRASKRRQIVRVHRELDRPLRYPIRRPLQILKQKPLNPRQLPQQLLLAQIVPQPVRRHHNKIALAQLERARRRSIRTIVNRLHVPIRLGSIRLDLIGQNGHLKRRVKIVPLLLRLVNDPLIPNDHEPTVAQIRRMQQIRVALKHDYARRATPRAQAVVFVLEQSVVALLQYADRRFGVDALGVLGDVELLLDVALARSHQVKRELRGIDADLMPAPDSIGNAQDVRVLLLGYEPSVVAEFKALRARARLVL